MSTDQYYVTAGWDADAKRWIATSDDVPGLVAEAETIEGLIDDLRTLIPDLLDINGVPHPARIAFALAAGHFEAIEPPA